jgi:16S rRNA (guanine527-N7)-methyltransferase
MKIYPYRWRSRIKEGLAQAGITVTDAQCALFEKHADNLLTWNAKINLTAITDPDEMAIKHYIDSALCTKYIPPGSRILDMGSGAGFPAIPLKITEPSYMLTLMDSVRKKVSFLQYVIAALNLSDVSAVHARAQDLARQPQFQKAFDTVICRAFSALETFVPLALPFVRPLGKILAMKGKISVSEKAAAARLRDQGFQVAEIPYTLPLSGAQRTLFEISIENGSIC